MQAIIEACGKQYKVAEGDVVFMEKLGAEAEETVTFDRCWRFWTATRQPSALPWWRVRRSRPRS